MSEPVMNWEELAGTFRRIAEKRLEEIQRQDAEIANLRKAVAALEGTVRALRAVAK